MYFMWRLKNGRGPADKDHMKTVTAYFTRTALVILILWTVVAFAQDVKKVSRADAMGAVVTKVQPDYPPLARQLKLEGSVELEAEVSETGTVEKVNIISGNPVLTRPAVNAVMKWKFTPFKSDGKPVKAVAPVSLAFKL